MGVSEKCCVYLLSPSVMLPASVMMFTDVSSCFFLPSRRESLSVRTLRPSLSPKRALFLPQCDSISLLLSAPFSYHRKSKSVIYHVANFVFHPLLKHLWHSLSLHCSQAVPTQQFYMQQSNATPRPSTPSSGCLPQFSFQEDVNSIMHPFLFYYPHSNCYFIVMIMSDCHQGNNAILTIIISQ